MATFYTPNPMDTRYKLSRDRQDELDILFGTINRFIGYFSRQAQQQTQSDPASEYPFIAMDTRQAYEQIRVAKEYLLKKQQFSQDLQFIDIGCGIGNILLMAELMEFRVFGIEKDPVPFKIAKNLLGDSLVQQTDIWKFNRFHDFDVIYYFRPFPVRKLQCVFEKKIENQLRPGGILIANRKMDDSINTDDRFSRIENDLPVWVKNQ